MITISKCEAEELRSNGFARFVFHTYTRNKHYFCVENPGLMEFLANYRNSKTLYVRSGCGKR